MFLLIGGECVSENMPLTKMTNISNMNVEHLVFFIKQERQKSKLQVKCLMFLFNKKKKKEMKWF